MNALTSRKLVSYDLVHHRDLWVMANPGDVIEVNIARCTEEGVEKSCGFVAVLFKVERREGMARVRQIGLTPIAPSIKELKPQEGLLYEKGSEELEVIDSEGVREWMVCGTITVHPHEADALTEYYLWSVETVVDAI